MKYLLLLCMLPVIALAESNDEDLDGVNDYKSYIIEDDGIYKEEPNDNCLGVFNPSQRVSPQYVGDEDKAIGTACWYDYDGDTVITVNDYGILVGLRTSYQIKCQPFPNGDFPPSCDSSINNLGDLSDDGHLSYDDTCLFLIRNFSLVLSGQVGFPTGCWVFK